MSAYCALWSASASAHRQFGRARSGFALVSRLHSRALGIGTPRWVRYTARNAFSTTVTEAKTVMFRAISTHERQCMVEPVFTQITANRRIGRFTRRGPVSAC
jgi:hypothetical protein